MRGSAGGAVARWAGPATAAVLAALALLFVRLEDPPAPVPADAPEDRFSAERALVHVEALARTPRPVGTPAHDSVRAYLLERLRGMDLEPRVEETRLMWREGTLVGAAPVRNVLVRIPGRDPTGTVALAAHYDSRWSTPGAADDAAGVAAILEALRALRAGGELPLRNDLVLLLTDGEELGLLGARALRDHPWMEDVDVVVNLEARGGGGPTVTYKTGRAPAWSLEQLDAAGVRPVTSSLSEAVYRQLGRHSEDFAVFRREGKAGLALAFIEAPEAYHTSLDTPGRLSAASLQHHGEHVLALARRLGAADLGHLAPQGVGSARGPGPADAGGASGRTGGGRGTGSGVGGPGGSTPDAVPVHFTLPGLGVVQYGRGWALLLGLLAGGAWLAAVLYARVEDRVTWRELAGGAGTALAGVAAAVGAAWALRRAALPLHPEAGWLVAEGLYLGWPYTVAAALAAAGILAGAHGLLRRWLPADALALGALAWPAFLSVGAAINVPEGSYLVAWPTLAGTAMAGLRLRFRGPRRPGAGSRGPGARSGPASGSGPGPYGARPAPPGWPVAAGQLLLAVPVLAVGGGALRHFHAALGVGGLPLLAGLVAVLLLCLAPLAEALGRPNRVWAPAAALAAATILAGATLARAASGPLGPVSVPLVHVVEPEAERAWWATARQEGNLWLDGFVPRTARGGRYLELPADLHGPERRRYRASRAPATPVPGVEVEVREGSWTPAGQRRSGGPSGDAAGPPGAGGGDGGGPRRPGDGAPGSPDGGETGRVLTVYLEITEPLPRPLVALEIRPDPSDGAARGEAAPELLAVDGRPVPRGAGPPGEWTVRHFGRPPGPVSLELRAPGGAVPRLEVLLHLQGLPNPPGPLRAERPEGMTATPMAGGRPALTDVTVVRHRVWVRVEGG